MCIDFTCLYCLWLLNWVNANDYLNDVNWVVHFGWNDHYLYYDNNQKVAVVVAAAAAAVVVVAVAIELVMRPLMMMMSKVMRMNVTVVQMVALSSRGVFHNVMRDVMMTMGLSLKLSNFSMVEDCALAFELSNVVKVMLVFLALGVLRVKVIN